MFSIVGLKNFDQPPDKHVWKGRIVLGGHDIREGAGREKVTLFEQTASHPSSMCAARCAVCYGCLRVDGVTLQTDCDKAYTQSLFDGPPTWVRLPRKWWPVGKGWENIKDPVCRLIYNLYGHPRAGNGWERYAEGICKKHGFEPVPEWPSVFWNSESDVLLVIYVDDLLGSGKESDVRACLANLRKDLKFGEPERIDKYLSCIHKFWKVDNKITQVGFDMCSYLRKACDEFSRVVNQKLKHVPTPYILDRGLVVTETREKLPGWFEKDAAHYLMTLLYGARMASPWLIVAITRLAARVHKWSAECDDRLIRIYDFVHDRIDYCIYGSLSTDDFPVVEIWAWPDADLAGDKHSSKSTAGRFIELVGMNGRGFPLHWSSHKLTGSSLSTPDNETASLSDCCKAEGLAIQGLFSLILKRPVVFRAMEDNTTCIGAVDKGYSSAMRYLPRSQRTSLGFLHEVFCGDTGQDILGPTILQYADTKRHKGDFFTKDSLTAAEFDKALTSIRVFPNREEFERGERVNRAQKPPILPSKAAETFAVQREGSATTEA